MIAIDTVQRTIIGVKKYGLYVFTPLFLIIAYNYTSSSYQQYRNTAKIEFKDISAAQASADLHSQYLVKQVLDELNLQASYYDQRSPREELYGNQVAVRLRFDGPHRTGTVEPWLNLDVVGKNSYTLTDEDTTAFYNFNQPVHASFGDFTVTRRPGNTSTQASYLVRLDDADQQLDAYFKNLQIDPDRDGRSLSMSIVSGNPAKGAAFLNKLLQLYGSNTSDRNGEPIAPKFTLIEKPQDNVQSITLNPLWFYFLALVAGLAIPLGIPLIRKKRSRPLPSWVFTVPKMVDHVIQKGFVFRQAD